MENNNDNESPKKSESADSLNIDAAKPVGGIRTTKKVTLD